MAETAKQLANRPAPRRALVVISDGVDTSSSLTPQQVSALASSIDVPVYVVAVVSPLDRPDRAGNEAAAQVSGNLADLANWTGGELLYVSVPDQTSAATRELIATMRQQYFLAIESASAPGWYALEVKTRRRGLVGEITPRLLRGRRRVGRGEGRSPLEPDAEPAVDVAPFERRPRIDGPSAVRRRGSDEAADPSASAGRRSGSRR